MFAFLSRNRAAKVAGGEADAAKNLSVADARRKRVLDRAGSQSVVAPERRIQARECFGLKPEAY